MTMTALDQEAKTYAEKLPELIGSGALGKFVLIKGDKVVGTFDSYADALKSGYEQFKLEPFMVKQVSPAEKIQFFTRELDLECHQ